MMAYLAVALSLIGVDALRRDWDPKVAVVTENYSIQSSATQAQTEEIAIVAEAVYREYSNFMKSCGLSVNKHDKLKVKLFKDRDEFRLCTRSTSWAEGFYKPPYCYQYYSNEESNPYHWFVHEAAHQMNYEVAGLSLPKWMEEGVADYFGTSRIVSNKLCLGRIDTNTYPVWWLQSLIATNGSLEADKKNLSVIPLRNIITNEGGPDLDKHFNLYYLHWWSLTHFLMEFDKGRYRSGYMKMISAASGDTGSFEVNIGRIEEIEKLWYAYLLGLKKEFSGKATPAVIIRPAGNS